MLDFEFEAFRDARSEIRLLTIHPGSGEGPLSCSLEAFSLSSLPTFEALSYTWGDNAAQNPIEINRKRFVAFGNAYDGLIELRDPASPRLIWIDAICINQQDLIEKQHQILLMKVVYEKASQVVVWLPRPRGNEDLAMGLLDELHSQLDGGTNTVQGMQAIHSRRLRSPEWIALRDFLHHPWWSRIWTLQEVVLGREVVIRFGRHTIPWERVRILGDDNGLLYGMFLQRPGEGLHSENGQPDGCGAIPIIQWMRDSLEEGQKFSLLDLIPQCWWRNATNTRDCIFGLCALSSDIDDLGLHPDYTMSVEEVLTNAVNKILLKHETLELFCKAGRGFPRKLPSLPSYVPDWTLMPIAQPLYWHFYNGPEMMAPDKRGISLHSNGKLQMKLFDLDSIEKVSEPLTDVEGKVESEQLLAWFDAAERMAVAGAQDPYPMTAPPRPSIPLFDAFWRTTIANSVRDRTRAPEDWVHGYLRYKYTLARQCGIPPSCVFESFEQYQKQYGDSMDRTVATMMDWYNIMLITSWNRAFCVTRNGMVGLAPPGTLPGDLVCLLPGGAVPFVMRPKESSELGDEFELVGESYFHGVTAIDAITEFRSQGKGPRTVFLV
ncbi:heterokaryon incompatibility protein-domain-containing protein [Pyrenochaeta sp. MPI-SDFR-AT-0127]|nr:heterokaryon incompatibility protein-domain-containing protein [Pyrenochaeta sp. MPI-SDFR-AT-0127]